MGLQRHLWEDCRLDKSREKQLETWRTDKLKDCLQPKGGSNVHKRRRWPAGVTEAGKLGTCSFLGLELREGPS